MVATRAVEPSPDRLPRLPTELLVRPRLFARLDRDAPLTVVRGPMGAGKTTLLVSWLLRRSPSDEVHRWVDLPPGGGAEDLWRATVDTLEDLGGDSQVTDPGPGPGGDLLARARASLRRVAVPVRLIIDGLEIDDLAVDRELHTWLRRHRWLRLVVGTRRRRPLEERARVDVDVVTLGPADLALTAEEQAELLACLTDRVDRDQVAAIRSWLGTSPAVTRAAGVALAEHGSTTVGHEAAAAAERLVADQLDASQLPAELLAGAARVAVLDVLEPSAVEHLLGSGWVPGHLEDAGLATQEGVEAGSAGPVLPGALRRVLRGRRAEHDPAAARSDHEAAARWFAEQGRPGEGLDHARLAEAWDLVLELLDQHFVQLLMTEERPLREALTALPEEVLDRRPVLRDALVVLRDLPLRGAVHRLSSQLDPVELEAALRRPDAKDQVSQGLLHAIALRMGGVEEASAEAAADLRAVLDTVDGARFHELLDPAAPLLCQLAISRFLGGDLRGAEVDFQVAYAEATAAGDELFAFDAATYTALLRAISGDVEGAETWTARAAKHRFGTPSGWLAGVVGTSGQVAAALAAVDRVDREAAEEALSDVNDPTSRDELWVWITHAQVRHALLWGDPYEMLARVDRARAAHPGRARPGSPGDLRLLVDEVDLWLSLGQIPRAERLLAGAPTTSVPVLAVRRARTALLASRSDEAASIATSALATTTASPRELLELTLLAALADVASGRRGEAEPLVGRAAGLLRLTGVRSSLLLLPDGGLEQLVAVSAEADAPLLTEPEGAAGAVFPRPSVAVSLTEREQLVLAELVTGKPLSEVARGLFVSENTVKTQLRSIYRKLEVSSRDEAVRAAVRLGLTDG